MQAGIHCENKGIGGECNADTSGRTAEEKVVRDENRPDHEGEKKEGGE
jgi:hypothetical protein